MRVKMIFPLNHRGTHNCPKGVVRSARATAFRSATARGSKFIARNDKLPIARCVQPNRALSVLHAYGASSSIPTADIREEVASRIISTWRDTFAEELTARS